MKAPMLATAILYFNKPTLTARCLTSVREASRALGRSSHEILLVDNGSRQARAGELAAADLAYTRLEPNQGFARGMNTALRAAFERPETRLVTLLSNDALPGAGFYERLGELARDAAGSGAAIFCPHAYFLVDRSKPAYTHGQLDVAGLELSHHFDPGLAEIRFPRYYPAAATVWTRAAFELLGGFDERYFCYWEDVELAHRCGRLGARLVPDERLRIHHLGRGTTGGKPEYSGHFARGRALTAELLNPLP